VMHTILATVAMMIGHLVLLVLLGLLRLSN
jgi:hypothetical protein